MLSNDATIDTSTGERTRAAAECVREQRALAAAAASHSFGLATEQAEVLNPEQAALAADVSNATRGGRWAVARSLTSTAVAAARHRRVSVQISLWIPRARPAALLCFGMASPPRCIRRRPRPPSGRSSERDRRRCRPQRRVRWRHRPALLRWQWRVCVGASQRCSGADQLQTIRTVARACRSRATLRRES
jgi:hypothetical protein